MQQSNLLMAAKKESNLRSIRLWLSKVSSKITVEPILACYIMPSVLAALATQNLNLEKACITNLQYGEEVCSALRRRETANYTFEESEVQRLVAGVSAWKSVLQSSLPTLLILFLGSWSDRHARRKPFLLIPIMGEFFCSLGLLMCAIFMTELPLEVVGAVEGLLPALAGGWMTMFMAVFSYVGDVTSEKTRTLRIGIVNMSVSLGIPVGMALSGILVQKVGFYGVYSISATLYVLGFTYGVLRIKEAKTPIPLAPGTSFLKDFFNPQHVAETFRVAFRAREGNRRTRIILLMFLSVMLVGPFYGQTNVVYLFTRYQFNWNEMNFSFFATYCFVLHSIGTVIGIGLLSHVFKVDDSVVGVLSCISKIVASLVFAFSSTELMFYIAPLLDILGGCSEIAMRSMVSKVVPTEELGKVNSLIGVTEAAAPLIFSPMYSMFYRKSLNILPGGFYLLSSFFAVTATFIFVWMNVLQRGEKLVMEEKPQADSFKYIEEFPNKYYANEGFEK